MNKEELYSLAYRLMMAHNNGLTIARDIIDDSFLDKLQMPYFEVMLAIIDNIAISVCDDLDIRKEDVKFVSDAITNHIDRYETYNDFIEYFKTQIEEE